MFLFLLVPYNLDLESGQILKLFSSIFFFWVPKSVFLTIDENLWNHFVITVIQRSFHITDIIQLKKDTSWEIDGETVETVADFIFWGSKITEVGDCSHEI